MAHSTQDGIAMSELPMKNILGPASVNERNTQNQAI